MSTAAEPKIEAPGPHRSSSGRAHVFAACFWLLSLAVFWRDVGNLASLSFHDERSSHILLIPFISAFLIFVDRRRIFSAPRYCPLAGLPLLSLAAIMWFALRTPLSHLGNTDRLSAVAFLMVLLWIAAFILFYGTSAFRAALFPLFFLLLTIPIPLAWADRAVSLLQEGSADTCYGLFWLIGVPVVRHGFQFSLPGADIQVAEECSGIHSALALLIAGLLLQHFLLNGTWSRMFFIAWIIPIAIFKNAVRIVTIAWLGIHVSPDFFHGELHRQGGLPFSILALAMLGLILWLLRTISGWQSKSRPASPAMAGKPAFDGNLGQGA